MNNDDRYNLIKPMIREGHIKIFKDIFRYVPKTVVATDLGINNTRFTEFIQHVGNLRVKDILVLASLCNIDPRELAALIFDQLEANRSKVKKLQ